MSDDNRQIFSTAFRGLNSKLEHSIVDVEQVNSRFDLALYYYLVSYNTISVLRSSDKIATICMCIFTYI